MRPVTKLMLPLVTARIAQGVSQGAVASRLGVSQPHISNLERGNGSPKIELLERYAEAVGLKLSITFDAE